MNNKLSLTLNISLSPQEVDLMSVLAVGELSKVHGDIISGYIQGIIERVIIEPSQVMITSDMPLILGAKAGYSGEKLTSYVRGWNQVGRRDDLHTPKNESLGVFVVGFDTAGMGRVIANNKSEAECLFLEHVGIDLDLDFNDKSCQLIIESVSEEVGQNITPKFLEWVEA